MIIDEKVIQHRIKTRPPRMVGSKWIGSQGQAYMFYNMDQPTRSKGVYYPAGYEYLDPIDLKKRMILAIKLSFQ